MASLRGRVEAWIRDQTAKIGAITWLLPPPPALMHAPPVRWRWPPWWRDGGRKEQEKRLREEYEFRRKQLHDLCRSVKAETVADLQDVLCSMVLSECVYKRPASEMVRVINKFKADFGGEVVSLERVQPSLDHVPHRYLLAEAGDTLFASFIGTKQYKDIITDANILQRAIFHEETEGEISSNCYTESTNINGENKTFKPDRTKEKSKPAAHRGFLARAKGIPALELYKLAQKKKRKLVLCGHSLGGAVAALTTLAILRVIASSPSKDQEKVQIKCITFSQPPVGNAALRDYVHRKGWQQYFKSYCIPEDLIPRILSPAYFHHYNAQPLQASFDVKASGSSIGSDEDARSSLLAESKARSKEQLVMGLGPVQTSFWRLSRLVPLEGIKKQLDKFKRIGQSEPHLSDVVTSLTSKIDEAEGIPPSLEIQEGSGSVSLAPLPTVHGDMVNDEMSSLPESGNEPEVGKSGGWRKVPYLPSYVPFGQLYLLGNSSVDFLPDSEYSKLTSVSSVLSELRERFQSHSMRSYRSRFQKIYDLCMCTNTTPFLGVEQQAQLPHLQQWLDLSASGAVEFGHIVESPVIHSATSVVPLGWSGVPGEKNVEPLKVDITGYGLHQCKVVQAQVNGYWCSTVLESPPSTTSLNQDLQKMRILIGPPLKQQLKESVVDKSLVFLSPTGDRVSTSQDLGATTLNEGMDKCLNGFAVYCMTDFVTVRKEVYFRARRVRLLGLEGAGKTSLFNAILGQSRRTDGFSSVTVHPQNESQEGMVGGLCYLDTAGVNLQELQLDVTHFREELELGGHDLQKKTDLIILVHNLSHKIPRCRQLSESQLQSALSLFLCEAKALDIPWILAITNKFSVSAHQLKMLVSSVMETYQASPSITEVTNSCPYIIPSAGDLPMSLYSAADGYNSKDKPTAAHRLALAPVNFVKMPFQKNAIMPVEGVAALCKLVNRVLLNREEAALVEIARKRLCTEMMGNRIPVTDSSHGSNETWGSLTASAVGASLGAGLGIVMAIVMGAASSLRKP